MFERTEQEVICKRELVRMHSLVVTAGFPVETNLVDDGTNRQLRRKAIYQS